MTSARNRRLPVLRALAMFGLAAVWAVACGGPQQLGGEGAVCFRSDDCQAGFACVPPAVGASKLVCSMNLSTIVSMVDGAPPAESQAGANAGGAPGAAGYGAAGAGAPASAGAAGKAGGSAAGGAPAGGAPAGGASSGGASSGGAPAGGAPAGGARAGGGGAANGGASAGTGG